MSLVGVYHARSRRYAQRIARAAHEALRRLRLGRSEWFRPSQFVSKVVRAVVAGRPLPKDPFWSRMKAADTWSRFRQRRDAAKSWRERRSVEGEYWRELGRIKRAVARQIEVELREAA
jgi:hypothetical protein